jgi:hypothetical protein
MLKKITSCISALFLFMAFFTAIPNALIGKNALFVTNFSHNLLHLVLGVLFLFVAVTNFKNALSFYKYVGFVFIMVAVLGAWLNGFEDGSVFWLIYTNGIGHIFNLVFGVFCVVVGTSGSRASHATESHAHNLEHH